jgi:hypothetical protein
VLREERLRAGAGVLGRVLAEAAPGVVDVGERVAGAGVGLEVCRLAGLLHRLLERTHRLRRGVLV